MRKMLCVIGVLASSLVARSQVEKYWMPVGLHEAPDDLFQGRTRPKSVHLYRLEEDLFGRIMEDKGSVSDPSTSFLLSIPDPDGVNETYVCHTAPVMERSLSDQYPGIYSFAGIHKKDPSKRIYFDYSPRGFHAMILSADNPTRYIDPVGQLGNFYMAYSRADMDPAAPAFQCLVNKPGSAPSNLPLQARGADDGILRTYRLALACTGEYARYFLNGTETTDAQRKTKVLSAMNTLLVRTNAIFERDFGIHLNLVANNDAVIYLNPATDPWTTEWNNQTQRTLDAVIGSGGYDIGHLLHKEASAGNNNGNAGCIGCVCVSGSKGSGFTSHVTPEGDPFVVDYTAHEMGHQFGANHTFTFSTESGTASQFEPGSGSTIMGYAGITGATDVQAHSDDYFHTRSIEQVTNYIKGTTGGGCAQRTATGNSIPVISTAAAFSIPISTPFMLGALASDANSADVLTYTWEQVNAGTASSTYPSTTASSGPCFRSRNNGSSPARSFPILSSILDGSNGNAWEKLPAVGRTLNFRVTVRDNHPGAGANQTADATVTVAGTAGPFLVTSPNTAVTWTGGTVQTISWSVNNTNLAPVSCSTVKISLSTDGGLTFPTVLTTATANDGTEALLIPNISSNKARIKVEAVGNIFFDISNVNFSITTGAACGTPGSLTASSIGASTATVSWASVSAAQSYELGYKAASSSTWIIAGSGITGSSFLLSGLSASTLYDWRVRSVCNSVYGSYANAQFSTLSASACINAYEPNEGIPSAKAIPVNGTISAAISSSTDRDFFILTVSAASNIQLTLTGLPADYDMNLYNSSGSLIASASTGGNSDESIFLSNQPAGNYYVEVFGYNGVFNSSVCYGLKNTITAFISCAGSYDNSTNGTTSGAALIPFNTNVTGLINPSGDMALYRFTITTPGTISLSLSNLPADYDLQLLNNAGTQVAISQNGNSAAESINYTAVAGTYYARVYGFSSAFHASSCYSLKVQLGTASRWVDGMQDSPDPALVLVPNPVQNRLQVQWKKPENLPCRYEIWNERGQRVKMGTLYRKEECLDLTLFAPGVYQIRLSSPDRSWQSRFIKL